MKVDRLFGSICGASLVLMLGLAKADSVSPAADPLAPSSLLSGPSLYETGQVGVSPDETASPTSTPVPPEIPWAGDGEKSIKAVATDIAGAPPPRPPQGVVNAGLLAQETTENFETLEDCRVDVARTKRVVPSKIVGDQLLLRWTIEPSGKTASTQVVATTPVDLDLMDCVKAAMSQWTFTPPRGGPFRVERTFAFRQLP